MNRAGKEPAEDVKRAFVRAIEMAGLQVHFVQMFKSQGRAGRWIMGAANPEGWAHKLPAIALHAFVDDTGRTGAVEIRCSATDDDPLKKVFVAPTVRHCSCALQSLPETLRAVWEERHMVVDRIKQGNLGPRFVGQWTWEVPAQGL